MGGGEFVGRLWGGDGGFFERADVAVTDAPAGFDEGGAVAGFAEGFADAADGFAETGVVDLLPVPEVIEELLTENHAVTVFDEEEEDEERFALKGDRAGAGNQQLFLWIKASRT